MAARISASTWPPRSRVAGGEAPAQPGGDEEGGVRDRVERLRPVARVGPLAIAVDRAKPVHRHSPECPLPGYTQRGRGGSDHEAHLARTFGIPHRDRGPGAAASTLGSATRCSTPAAAGEAIGGATHILVTHGHGDHTGDALAISREERVPGGRNLRPDEPLGEEARDEDGRLQQGRHGPARRGRGHHGLRRRIPRPMPTTTARSMPGRSRAT